MDKSLSIDTGHHEKLYQERMNFLLTGENDRVCSIYIDVTDNKMLALITRKHKYNDNELNNISVRCWLDKYIYPNFSVGYNLEEFKKGFTRKALLEDFEKGERNIQFYHSYYDENGNLYNEGHRFFLIKMHLKYLGKNTSKIQFDSPIICKYPDGTYYSLGGIDYIDKALLENESHHITLNPGDEFDSWFLYEAYRYSHDKTYYLRGSFQNYIDDDSYSGYLVKLNDIEDVE